MYIQPPSRFKKRYWTYTKNDHSFRRLTPIGLTCLVYLSIQWLIFKGQCIGTFSSLHGSYGTWLSEHVPSTPTFWVEEKKGSKLISTESCGSSNHCGKKHQHFIGERECLGESNLKKKDTHPLTKLVGPISKICSSKWESSPRGEH